MKAVSKLFFFPLFIRLPTMKQKYQCHKLLDKNVIMIMKIALFCIYNVKAEEGVVATSCSLK